MRIDPKQLPGVNGETPKVGGPSQGGRISGADGPTALPAAKPTDGVTLSQKAEEFLKARLQIQDLPEPGRADRVASLKSLVAAGSYSVDGRQIAAAMLQDEPTAALLGLSTTR